VLVVSHDRWLLDRVATSILAFDGEGHAEYHVGNYSDYAEVRARSARGAGRIAARELPVSRSAVPTQVASPGASPVARPKKLSFAEQRELDGMLDAIAGAEERLEALQVRLADPATYQGEGGGAAAIRAELAQAEAEVARLTARWETLESRAARTGSRS
jgi:ABC transport system ATP-binding/permease protein